MNERIRELQKQSSIEQWNPDTGCYRYILNPEKFAELIVKECALALDKTIAPTSHPFNSIGWRLKEHFGVE